MDMLPEPVSNVLHREIKRVHHLIDDVEERVSSIQETQTAGMVQVHRRIEKLEMDSEDIQEALKRFLSGSVGDLKPDPHNSVSAPDSNSRDFEAADEGKADGEDPQGSLRVRRSPSPELAEAFERIVKLERALIWICDIQKTLIHDVDRLKRETCSINKQSKVLKELQFMVKSPEQRKGPQERMREIHSAEQPVVDSEDGRALSSGKKLQEELMTYFGGKMDHLRQVDLSLSNMEAGSRVEALKTTILPAKSSQPFEFDLDFRRTNWDFAENRISEKKTNMDIDTCVEDKSSYTSRSLKAEKVLSLFESTAEVQRMSHLPKKELEFIQLGAMSTDQQLNSHQREKEDLPSIRDQALKRNCTGDLEHQAERDSSSIIARASDTEKTERLKADSVDDEDAVAKTHKVLEAYGIDLYVEP